jgi:AcrR family transcriptional regulator
MSPRSKEDNELLKEQRKEQILDVSLRLFANLGYESTSISRIAKEAGISKGLLYNYFESKEALLKSLVSNLNSMEENFMDFVFDEDPRKMLEKIFISYFNLISESKNQLRLITVLAFQVDKFDFIQDIATQKMTSYRHLFTDLLTKIGYANPSEEALLIGVILDGIVVQYLAIHKDYPLNELKELLINKYCNTQ